MRKGRSWSGGRRIDDVLHKFLRVNVQVALEHRRDAHSKSTPFSQTAAGGVKITVHPKTRCLLQDTDVIND